MPRDSVTGAASDPAATRAAAKAGALNTRFAGATAQQILHHALTDAQMGRICTVSSFGAESVVLLHMISRIAPAHPVLFIDTRLLFAETLAYQFEVARTLGLTGVEVIRAAEADLAATDPAATLHKRSTDACCTLRKTVPLANALRAYDGWVTGRKRFQAEARATLAPFESEGPRLKINPLAGWTAQDLKAYMQEHALPRHPLVAHGYPSIGCRPCTTPVVAGEDARAGRWRGEAKEECGIHFIDDKVVRTPLSTPSPTPTPAPDQGGAHAMHNTIVTDTGFTPEDWAHGFTPLTALGANSGAPALAIDLAPDDDPSALSLRLDEIDLIRVTFSSFSDGRGFSQARTLRAMGYAGRLRAAGHVISDQYGMARRCGFDEVEIAPDLAARQPEAEWQFRADWQSHDYQARLRA